MAFPKPNPPPFKKRLKNPLVCAKKFEDLGVHVFPTECVTGGPMLGKGTYGIVNTATVSTKAGQTTKAAMKTIRGWDTFSWDDKREHLKLFEKEVKIHSMLKHTNVVELLGVTITQPGPSIASVLEYACVDLCDFANFGDGHHVVHNLRQLLKHLDDYGATEHFLENFNVHRQAAEDIAQGLSYLHAKDITHRDLKPENVLVSTAPEKRITCKLTDFGESRAVAIQTASIHTRTTNLDRGTVVYNAPEINLDSVPGGAHISDLKRVDVWSYGMTVFAIMNPSLPWPWRREVTDPNTFKQTVIEKMKKGKLPSHSEAVLHVRLLDEIFRMCCTYRPSQRPQMTAVVELYVSSRQTDRMRTPVQSMPEPKEMASDTDYTTHELSDSVRMSRAQPTLGKRSLSPVDLNCKRTRGDEQEAPSLNKKEILDMTVKAGQDIRIAVPVKGHPPLTITWEQDDTILTSADRCKMETPGDKAILVRSKAQRGDTGTYTVKVKNDSGCAEGTVEVTVLDAPGKCGSPIEATNIKADEIALAWQPPEDNGGAKIEQYILEKRPKGSQHWQKVPGIIKEPEATVQNLDEATEYEFRVMAVNENGEGEPLETEAAIKAK